MVKVISLKCVQQRTKPKKIVPCIIKNKNEPLFQAFSCLSLKENKNILRNKCIINNKKIRSTPLSCNQKKSSVYKSSESSSSLDVGINIGSLIKLNEIIMPVIH